MPQLKLFEVVLLVSLCAILTKCSLIRDPMLNRVISGVLIPSSDESRIKILSSGNSYKLYWYDSTQGIYREGPPLRDLLSGPGDQGYFDVVTNPNTNSSVIVFLSSGLGSLRIDTKDFYIPLSGCSVTYKVPKALYINNATLVISWSYYCPTPIEKRINGSGSTVPFQQSNTEDLTSNSLVIHSFNRSEWINVWMNYDLNVVQGIRGADTTGSLSPVFNITSFPCINPIVHEGTMTCIDAADGRIVVAHLGLFGTATSIRWLDVTGSKPQVRVMKGAQSTVTVLTFIDPKTSDPCVMVQSVQYPTFSAPLCWTEQVGDGVSAVYPPVLTALANHSFVVAYPLFIYNSGSVVLKAQTFALTCGDGFVGPDEQCDSSPNCNSNCMCEPNYYASRTGTCVFDLSTPVVNNPDVVPILDCFVALNQTHVRGYFSHDNLQQQTAVVPIGPKNSFSVIGQDVGQPTVFSPGRTTFFPASSFAVTWNKQNIDWTLTKYQLTVNTDAAVNLCPKNVTIEVDVIVSRVPNATELQQIAEKIAEQLGIDPSRVIVVVVINGDDVKLVITILDGGIIAIDSVIAAEKLIDIIRNEQEQLEEEIKEVVPIVLNGGTVRGQPGATQGQKGVSFEPPVSAPSSAVSHVTEISNVFRYGVLAMALLGLSL